MQIIERKFQNILKEVYQVINFVPFTSVPKYQFCIKREKNKQTKYITADQVVDMQTVNFALLKQN